LFYAWLSCVGANAPIQMNVKKGEVVFAAFWARAANLPAGKSQITMPYHLQQTGEPYQQFASREAVLTSAWHQYYIHAEMPKKQKRGSMGLAAHLAGSAATLELGPVYLLNMGEGAVDRDSLPKNTNGAQTSAPAATAQPARILSSAQAGVPPALSSDYAGVKSRLSGQAARLLASPDISSAQVYGENETHRIVSDAGVPGGKAVEVTVSKAGENSWSAGINWSMSEGVAKGDVVFLAFWAKGLSAENEAQTPVISPVRVQENQEPYRSALDGAAYLSRDWKLYFAASKSDLDIPKGTAGMSFHIGLSKQSLRLGPAYLFNLGPSGNINALPRNKVSYEGQSQSAPWRAKAKAKIEQHRKSDLTIKVLGADGQPKAGALVSAELERHAFNFGTFVGHEFIGKKGEKDERYHKSFHENFNMATLPLYWQDWGFNGKDSLEPAYRKTVKYAHEQDMRWRGHPIFWPGESYMPSRILKAEGKPKAQRKMVLDHVEKIMKFIAPYQPFAVDMVNEVRVNQYFKENGNPDLVEDAFKLAHEIAPEIPLFVNDYGILNNGGFNEASIKFYHDWIKRMRAKDVPLGGIGFQAHFGSGLTDPQRVMDILAEFAEYGLPLHLTEFDIETYDSETQADYTRDMLYAAFSEPAVEAFVVWGWWEGDHWKAPAAMLNKDWSPRPNYRAWRDTIFTEFWTREQGQTDASGLVTLRGFKGDYKITIGGQQTRAVLDGDKVIEIRVP